MIAILSTTLDDLYVFNLPFAVHSWAKLGIKCILFHTRANQDADNNARMRYGIALQVALNRGLELGNINLIEAPEGKRPTYAQCSRLYAGALEIPGYEILITSDADMCVFDKEYWRQFDYQGWVNVIGADLVPAGQYPMCYISMPTAAWRGLLSGYVRTYQDCLDDLLGGIEAENFRGNYWAKDQETIYKALQPMLQLTELHNRASPGTQFATRRADRDGWFPKRDIIDAHLPRPGYTPESFAKIKLLFMTMYPDDDHSWMDTYHKEYIKLMEG